MVHIFKKKLVNAYHFLKYKDARKAFSKNIPFDHFRELNQKWLKDFRFKTILDVGANQGQFAKLARMVFPETVIHSFEPLPECFEQLKATLVNDSKFFPHNLALGKENSFLDFFRSQHSPSSSFLEMEESHKKAFPESKFGHKDSIRVEVSTLENIFIENELHSPILLKIDVQGFEAEVLKGGRSVLDKVSVIIIEMSLISLYKDQPLFNDVYHLMYDVGFRYHGNLSQMLDPKTGEVVQIDAIFKNEMYNK